MALSIKEQHNIRTEKIRPEGMTLVDMITIFGYTDSQFFIDNAKETDPNTLADSYKQKMIAVANRMKQKDTPTIISLLDGLLNIWKNFQSYTTMKTWNDNDWESQVEGSYRSAAEVAAGVSAAEKTAYTAL